MLAAQLPTMTLPSDKLCSSWATDLQSQASAWCSRTEMWFHPKSTHPYSFPSKRRTAPLFQLVKSKPWTAYAVSRKSSYLSSIFTVQPLSCPIRQLSHRTVTTCLDPVQGPPTSTTQTPAISSLCTSLVRGVVSSPWMWDQAPSAHTLQGLHLCCAVQNGNHRPMCCWETKMWKCDWWADFNRFNTADLKIHSNQHSVLFQI